MLQKLAQWEKAESTWERQALRDLEAKILRLRRRYRTSIMAKERKKLRVRMVGINLF